MSDRTRLVGKAAAAAGVGLAAALLGVSGCAGDAPRSQPNQPNTNYGIEFNEGWRDDLQADLSQERADYRAIPDEGRADSATVFRGTVAGTEGEELPGDEGGATFGQSTLGGRLKHTLDTTPRPAPAPDAPVCEEPPCEEPGELPPGEDLDEFDEVWVVARDGDKGKEARRRRELERAPRQGAEHRGQQRGRVRGPVAMADPRGRARRPVDMGEAPGGCLMAVLEEETVPLPLRHTDVKARVLGYVAAVDVSQEFQNPYDTKIEAIYVFPLPSDAAVNEFVMQIGDRRIRGIIREREEAERIYRAARRQGYTASLLTQERPNVFTQKVANIEPGKQIAVDLRYYHTLKYDHGWYEFAFPMVVGPRFNPPGTTSGVAAAPRGARPGSTGQATEVTYLKPGQRSGHDIALSLEIDAGVSIERVISKNHRVVREKADGPEQVRLRLRSDDTIPNKDFVLQFKVAGERMKAGLVVEHDRDGQGGTFAFMLYPPAGLKDLPRAPLEMVFVLDCSGSMSGEPLDQAKDAIRHCLERLNPRDTFQVIRFSSNASRFGSRPVQATEENVEDALDYVDDLEGGGGTLMIEGIKAALDFPHDPRRLRVVTFLTDGFIGNEQEILAAIDRKLGATRIFSFGVGSSPNRYLMERMAKLGRGVAAYVGLNDDGARVMNGHFQRLAHPAFADVRLDLAGCEVSDVYPRRIPDLFVGKPVLVTGRFRGNLLALPESTRVLGRIGGRPASYTVTPRIDHSTSEALASSEAPSGPLTAIWARQKIKDLYDRATITGDPGGDLQGTIRQVALDYSLMSAYTAFVAVDSSQRTGGREGVTVPVAVPVPDGVRYDTTVAGE